MKKQITRTLAYMLCLCTLSYYNSFSQCGAAPTAGLTTISSANIIVNAYYPGKANATAGTKNVSVGAFDNRSTVPGIAVGDMVLIIQMQGADFTTTNSNRYGDNSNGDPGSGYSTTNLRAGSYEYNVVSAYNSGTGAITLSYNLINNYYNRAYTATLGIQTFQVIKVKREFDLTINSGNSITAPAWNGSTGGVVVLEIANKLTLNGTVTVDGLGFRGGGGKSFSGVTNNNSSTNTAGGTDLDNNDYRWNSPVTNTHNTTGGAKGEGIAGTPAYVLPKGATNAITNTGVEGYIGGSMGRGAPGNAGGGGTDGDVDENQYNTGGGGGANGGDGGKGGSGWDGGNHNQNKYPTGGFGGKALDEVSKDRFVMGGGGGAGTANNATAGTNDYISSGGCGGGIVIIRAKYYSGSGTVSANGAAALNESSTTDAAGGGGAGGSIIVIANNPSIIGTHTITASANGGKGGDMSAHFAHGPGGGGGGGYVLTNVMPTGSVTITGAASGRTKATSVNDDVDDPYGSTAGSNGVKSVTTSAMGLTNSGGASVECGTLPITLSKWSGIYKNNKTYLSWEADNASNFSHFVVERSSDGVHFSPLGDVAGISGAPARQYSFEDAFPTDGVNYYRLKMVDLDGRFTYSGVLIIRSNGSGIQITATPNPFTDHVVISIQSTTNEPANLRVFNNEGKLVWRKTTYVNAGTNVQYFNELQSLPTGVYIIKVNKGNTTGEFKMIKQ